MPVVFGSDEGAEVIAIVRGEIELIEDPSPTRRT